MKLPYGFFLPTATVIQGMLFSKKVAATPPLVRREAQDQTKRILGGCDMSIAGIKRDCIEDKASLLTAVSDVMDSPGVDSIIEFCNKDTPIALSEELYFNTTSNLELCCSESECILEKNDGAHHRLLHIEQAAAVTIRGMTFTGGEAVDYVQSENGGNAKITATGDVFIKKSIFQNGTGHFGGGLSLEGIGGAVTFEENVFRGNDAEVNGGGFYAEDVVGFFTIKKDLYEENSAGGLSNQGGGGFYVTANDDESGTDMLIKESTFLRNSVPNGWGSVFYTYNLIGADFIMEKCTVNGNSADECGALVERQSNGTILFLEDNFIDNIGVDYGAGLCVYDEKDRDYPDVTISKCDFIGNNVTGGYSSAVDIWEASNVLISETLFENNVYGNSTGINEASAAMRIVEAGSVVVKNCKFKKNVGDDEAGALSIIENRGDVLIQMCEFKENVAQGGFGSFYFYDSEDNTSILVDECKFEDNQGGSIRLYDLPQDSDIIIRKCDFKRNNVTGDVYPNGGGLSALEVLGTISILESLFEENEAEQGGAIYISDGTDNVTIFDTFFKRNGARLAGGAVFIENIHGLAKLEKCNVEENSSQGNVGGVSIDKADAGVFIRECNFKKNTAVDSVGGLRVLDINENVLIDKSKFEENQVTSSSVDAYAGGLALNALQKNATIQDSEFRKNLGGEEGGGFAAKNLLGTLLVVDSKFEENEAVTGGAGYVSGDANVRIFANNDENNNVATECEEIYDETFGGHYQPCLTVNGDPVP